MNDFNETKKEYENRIDSLNLNITGGCNRCRHYKSEFNDQFKLIHFCKNKQRSNCESWWFENGKLSSNLPTSILQCFDATVHEKALTEMNNTAKNILESIKNYDKHQSNKRKN